MTESSDNRTFTLIVVIELWKTWTHYPHCVGTYLQTPAGRGAVAAQAPGRQTPSGSPPVPHPADVEGIAQDTHDAGTAAAGGTVRRGYYKAQAVYFNSPIISYSPRISRRWTLTHGDKGLVVDTSMTSW